MATEGVGSDKAPVQSGGKSRFEQFKDRAELSISSVSLVVSIVLAGVSIYQAGRAGAAADEANAAAADANDAVREGNEIASDLGTIDALSFQQELRGSVPRVLITDGGNRGGGDGYSRGTGWNPSPYPAVVLGADLEFRYSNVEGDNENSNAALERTTIESCRLQVWSTADDGTVGSASVSCSEPVSVAPGDVLWVTAGIPEDQKKMFCARHPKGIAGFEIEVRHALFNVRNDVPEVDPPAAVNLACDGRSFPEPP